MAAPPDPTAAYRKQQGLGPITQSYDPQVVDWIVKAAGEQGADPVAMLATALQESGARLHGPAGDGGTSYSTFQFHKGGALGNHPPAWAATYPAFQNRAGEFARLKVHGGKGAAAVQRPRDPALYARGVDSYMEQARRIIAAYSGDVTKTVKASKTKPQAPADDDFELDDDPELDEGQLITGAMLAMQRGSRLAKLPGSSIALTGNPIQDALNRGAALAHTSAPTLPAAELPVPTVRPAAPKSTKPLAVTPLLPDAPLAVGKVVPGKARIIGGPAAHRARPIGNWQSDNAVDIALKVGTPIRAPADGVIGSRIGSLNSKSPLMQGLRVNLAIKGNDLYFAHLSRLAVKAGQHVKAGQIIGYSGVANGVAHLHLGSRVGNPGKYA